jgi:uncharacterized protein (TIGR02596 family)
MKTNRQSAFSLVELIVVAAVIAVIIGFAVPAANNLIKGSQLTQGSQTFGDLFSFARQAAMSRSRPVEIRFYRYGDLDTPGEAATDKTTWKFHGYQLFEILENGAALPINKMQRLPKMVIMSASDPSAGGGGGATAKYSTLLNTDFRGKYKDATLDPTAPEIPVSFASTSGGGLSVGRNYEFASFRYLQDGSTDLPPGTKKGGAGAGTTTDDTWYITLINLNDESKPIEQVNFYTVQVDPVSGATKSYRPGGT